MEPNGDEEFSFTLGVKSDPMGPTYVPQRKSRYQFNRGGRLWNPKKQRKSV